MLFLCALGMDDELLVLGRKADVGIGILEWWFGFGITLTTWLFTYAEVFWFKLYMSSLCCIELPDDCMVADTGTCTDSDVIFVFDERGFLAAL